MERKDNLKGLLSGFGKNAKSILDKIKEMAVQAIDQNADGKFGLEDVSSIADSMGDAMKRSAQAIRENAGEKGRLFELKTLRPIFRETLDEADFLLPKFIRVTERDKKRAESEVCQGSIGYLSDQKGLRIVNLFSDSLDAFGVTFYPDADSEFYYVDPSDRDHYIAINEYFSHLKLARVNELQMIAQSLGAKHFKVTYKEEKATFAEKTAKAKAKTPVANAEVENKMKETQFAKVEVAAEMNFVGHAPVKPQIRYLQKDTNVQTLIAMRMDASSPLLNHKFVLKLSNTSGIKEQDAAKIDAVLHGMKCNGNAAISSEVKNESRRYLEYEINF